MRRIKASILITVVILTVIGFATSLLTEYASATVPRFFVHRPYLVWILIVIGLAALIILTIWQYELENRESSSKPQPTTKHVHLNQQAKSGGTAAQPHKYDIFISYSHRDADWVREILLPKLESCGFSVLIDFRDFRGGSFGIEEMQRGILESRRVILVLTENYLKSDWTRFENVMAQTTDPGAQQRKIIPVLRESCNIPLRLRVLHYRDLRTEDDQQWQLLIRDLM